MSVKFICTHLSPNHKFISLLDGLIRKVIVNVNLLKILLFILNHLLKIILIRNHLFILNHLLHLFILNHL